MITTLGIILMLLLLLSLHHVWALAPQPRRSLPAGLTSSSSSSSQHEQRRCDRYNRRRQVTTTTRLWSSDDKTPRGGGGGDTTAAAVVRRGVDWTALGKYAIGMATQLSLLYGLFRGLDQVITATRLTVPFLVNVVFFYIVNANTGRFNPLSKQQVKPKAKEFRKPTWTPPGWVFAVMWPLFVFGTRAVTAAVMVQAADGRYATTAIMSLMMHLSFGNLWNTVNRVEQRLGASVPVLYGLLLSNVYASYQFYLRRPVAGKWLLATSTWLAAAAALETHVWLLNPDSSTGQPEPLYPAKDDKWQSKFQWEEEKND